MEHLSAGLPRLAELMTGVVRLLILLLAGFLTPTHQAQSAVCVFKQLPLAPMPQPGEANVAPRIDPYVLEPVRGANPTRPFTLEFVSAGPAWFHWRSPSAGNGPRLQQRVVIDVQPAGSSEFVTFCSTDWTPVDMLPTFGRSQLVTQSSGAASRWRIRVFQHNTTPEITILDENLSEVMVSGAGVDASHAKVDPPPLPYFDFLRPPIGLQVPACQVGTSLAPPDVGLVQRTRLPAGALDTPGEIHALSGRNIYVKVNEWPSDNSVAIRFDAKPIGQAVASTGICASNLTRDGVPSGSWISASIPWNFVGDTLRWTVNLASGTPSSAVDIEVYRDRQPSRPSTADTHAADVYTCTRLPDGAQKSAPTKQVAVFQGAYALTVRTGLLELGISGEPYSKAVNALLNAIMLWRSTCTKCTPYQFSVIAVDGDVYVPQDMLKGTPENYRATFATRYPWQKRIIVEKNSGAFTTAKSFAKMSGTLRQKRRFCNQLAEENNKFAAADSPLCRATKAARDEEMIINIQWDKESMPCGNRTGIVACWNGTDLIRMNLGEFSFYAGDIGQVLVGSSPRQVDLIRVFTHEVGHWLGLGHLEQKGSVMNKSFSSVRCVDDAAQAIINSIAAGTTSPSYQPEALLYAD
ncbi:matrixin family metalloprotease [Dechloromonas sp. A34]|uniref:matrixin family metalloprotease n=1 Tax=Dechloromonas sp. A34 TaxID=447588 RepID=UPI0022490364|nr:matrixin family metalloprotease [Dechloromonas sp. A34]